ncbi:putative protein N(5)-glutamine methyltransferase [Streptacidiphilus sp. EB129]|uniref:putative protein N(5)-glutamine methyltransferase n=1 Tax=Streptacidiphilus sp. EB129 TaxID=3156262 RepID=UPI003518028B
MSLPISPLQHSALITRLRTAGCVFAEDEADLLVGTATTPDHLDTMVDRRVDGLPLEHVLGWAEFCGLRVTVDTGVFVPRRRTEFLVRRAVAQAPAQAVVVDLCCGTGALGAALAASLADAGRPVAELHAADIDPAEVECARRNLAGTGALVYRGDLFAPLPEGLLGRVDVLLSNAPYVPTDDVDLLPHEARIHEARVALDGGSDGLDVLRRVAAEAPRWLAPGGRLLFEVSERQAPEALAMVTRNGMTAELAEDDELYATVVIGTRA